MSEEMEDNKAATSRQGYSGKIGTFKFISGFSGGFLSITATYAIKLAYPDMTAEDQQYMAFIVVPTICGIPPYIHNWLKNHELGRILSWWFTDKYNGMILKVFGKVPKEVIDGTSEEGQKD